VTDVVVVGGSLAGASTAIHLARRGLDVQIIDRAAFPRSKACGEGLFPRGVEALDDLGILNPVLEQARIINSVRLQMGDVSVEGSVGSWAYPTIGIRRDMLDATLLAQAQSEGVEVHSDVTAVDLIRSGTGFRGVQTSEGDYEARAIVLADGLRSRMRRVAGLDALISRQRYGVSAHYLLEEECASQVQIYILDGHEIYVTPVGERTLNVALLTGKEGAKRLAGDLSHSFEAIIQDGGVLPLDAKLLDGPLAAGPFPARARREWSANLLLVGDAAGFFDGISGEGMSLALITSKLAAEAVYQFLQSGSSRHFVGYERAKRGLVRNSNLLARVSLFVASHPSVGRHFLRNLSNRPATFEKILKINAGLSSLSALNHHDLRCLLMGI
jgi:flavin-dependent dehydrogenase